MLSWPPQNPWKQGGKGAERTRTAVNGFSKFFACLCGVSLVLMLVTVMVVYGP